MPIYSYECSGCSHEFEELKMIAEFDKPVNEPCPSCQKTGDITRLIGGAPMLCDSMLLEMTKGLPKPTRDFNERLRHIKKVHPGSPIEVRD